MPNLQLWMLRGASRLSICAGMTAAGMALSPQLLAQAAESTEQLTTEPVSEAAQGSPPAVAPLPVIEEVFVTGSLLPRGNYMSNAPITTVDSEQFEITSTVNLESLLNTMPQILAGSDRTSTFGFGWATADLRGLGENRTLTLLDGKRIVPSFADGGTVDLNLMPPGIIERVEILTGGASTTYGSDAMAGVINLITKSNVDGFEINAAPESTGRGDAQIHNVAGTWGTYFGADRGHVMVHVDLSKRRSLGYQDRDFSKSINVDAYDAAGNPTGFVPDLWPVNTSGVFTSFGNAPDYQFSSQGDLVLFSAAEQGYNSAQDTMLQLPQERGVIFAKTYWQGDGFELRAQAHIANSKLERQQPPTAFGWQSLAGPAQITFEANPFLSNSAKFTMLTNPLFQFFNAGGNFDFNGNGIPDIANVFLGRVVDELGSTSWDQEYALSQFEIGLSFDLGDMWSVDSSINYGEIEMDWLVDPALDLPRIRQALLLNPFDPTGQTCMNPSNGCVPLNIYGPNNLSQAAQDFVRTNIDMNNSSKLLTFNSVLTGNTADFFEMPGGAGPLGVALGVEYLQREQTLTTD
ncbi:MAG: TonB-dependent receptor plug domain-containing protein, partial [Proteobacteria bacterium]|nr:TonB-dependent receptor plug domain-containing protein [Pseudomonadota bacterium]